jgi:SAM-dependent methyltransferase
MGLLSALIEKTYFYPLNHRCADDSETVRVQARGDGLYPLLRDGDILVVQQASQTDLQVGDLALLQHPSGEIALRFVLRKAREKAYVKAERNRLNGDERLVGRIGAIDREGQRKTCDDRLARLAHVMYFSARPLIRVLLIVKRILSLLHPRFFVRGPESSLRCVAEKFDDAEEVLYYSQRVFEGLDEQEQLLVEQLMSDRGRVLNIGCGAGREAFTLAQLGFDVVGVDIAPHMIAEAKRHAQTLGKHIHFDVKSATDLDYPSNSFDYVLITAGVYSHIPTRQLRIDMLGKIIDLLTPNGILFFLVLYRTSSFFSRISLYDAFRSIAKPLLNRRLHSEPGDVLVRYVSPVGTPSKLCYVHFFKDSSEVLEEIALAGFDGFEDEKSGYWIVRPLREGNSQGTVPREVAA